MDKRDYKPRIIEQQIDDYLATYGEVFIEGPKW